jgi:hypothetical protein
VVADDEHLDDQAQLPRRSQTHRWNMTPANPHTQASLNGPARLADPRRTAPNSASCLVTKTAQHRTADAEAGTIESHERHSLRTQAVARRHGLLGLLLALLLLLLFPHHADARCRTHKCWHRVSVHRHIAYAWRWVKAHPMPRCTWIPESGPLSLYGQWSPRRYRVKNSSSTAAGKFQMLDQSAHAAGIPDYPGTHDAAKASRLAQEKAARRLLAMQGPGAWVNC